MLFDDLLGGRATPEMLAKVETATARADESRALADRARVRAERDAAMADGPGVWSAGAARLRARREKAGLEPPVRPPAPSALYTAPDDISTADVVLEIGPDAKREAEGRAA